MNDGVNTLSTDYSIVLTEASGACFSLYAARDEVTLMTATANPIHLMHIRNVHSIKTSHWQAATEEQPMILVQPTGHSYL